MEKILLIDDNSSILDAYQSLLSSEGLDVTVAENCEDAFEILKNGDFQIIITDIYFKPGAMDGFQFIRKVKKIYAECEIIVITGYADINIAVKAVNQDISNFILKPCKKKILLSAIQRASEKLKMKRGLCEKKEKQIISRVLYPMDNSPG